MKIDLDLHVPNEHFALKFRQGSNHTLILNLYSDGTADTSISGYTATLHIYTNVSDVSTYQIDSASTDASAGTMTFNITPGDLPPQGTYQGAEIIIKDGSDNPFFYAEGSATVRRSILGAAVSALTSGATVVWSNFTAYTGTAASGPYRAGDNVTFDENADGSVDINSTGGGGSWDHTATQDIEMAGFGIHEVADLWSGAAGTGARFFPANNGWKIRTSDAKVFAFTDGSVTHNDMSNDWDFILRGQIGSWGLYFDASTDRTGLGTNTPSEILDVVGNIAVSGTVDGRDVATDGTKLDGVEANATADQSDSEIETAYNNQVAAMSQVTAEAGTSTTVERVTAQRIRQNVDASEAAVTAVTVTIDGGGSAITTGALGKFPTIPYSGTIQSIEIAADQTGSIVVDIWKAASAIPTNSDSITDSTPPTLSSQQRETDSTLTNWTTAVAAGDVLGFEVDSAAAVTSAVLTIKIKKG